MINSVNALKEAQSTEPNRGQSPIGLVLSSSTPDSWRQRHCSLYIDSPMKPHHTTTILRPFFQDHPGEPVPEENFWTLWCKGRLTEADTQTIRLGATPSGLTTAHLHHPLQRKYTVIFQCMQILQTDRWTSIHLKASLPRQPK